MNDVAETGRDDTTRTQLDRLLALTAEREPIRMAVVHLCDEASLGGALEAFRMKLIMPVLVGPAACAPALGIAEPRVAVLAVMETVHPKKPLR